MDFELSDEQEMLREVSRSMLAAHCSPEKVRDAVAIDVDDSLWQLGADMGWTGLPVPEKHGGAAMGLVETTIVAEEIGRALAPGPWTDTAIAAWAASSGGAPDDVIAGLASGDQRASAVIDPGFIQAAASADWLLVVEDAVRLIPANATQFRRRTTLDETRRFYAAADLADSGYELAIPAQRVRDAAAVMVAADALGVAVATMRMTIDYATVRQQFNRPIGSFQVVKHKIADMLIAIEGLRSTTYYAAMALDVDLTDASLTASAAKAFAAEKVPEITGEALQIHGGIGFTWEHDLHLYLRRAKTDEVLGGAADFHHDRVATLLV
ncbi:acyl-CoA dehydrogenase family protein [Gordonia humi]|uniref:Alkylation response protein AidB-like acyl-CoA dehydrogenase n=1 Tax=Gordonia humi TaxID=686429 RepID=A0A840EQ72_9ACTN|nr:acyl-CoA dehydrogenase family protein [Gordonia humi]MBB4133852.1 alkylation response protein AidB-like acyl-CoA dehydrogenase [Gordonia humi]